MSLKFYRTFSNIPTQYDTIVILSLRKMVLDHYATNYGKISEFNKSYL